MTLSQKDRTIEELLDENNRLEKIIASLGDAVSIHDLNYKIIYQNQAIKDLAGDHVGEYCYRAYHHRDEVCANCPVSEALLDGTVHSAVRELITAEGRLYMEIIASPLKNAQGEITGSIEVARNITARRQAEEELYLSKQMLEDITQGITDSILLLSKDLKIQWANKATLQQTGLSMPELTGSYCYKATHHRDCPCEPPNDPCPAAELLKTGNPVIFEHTHFDKGGNTLAVEVSAYPVKDQGGEAVKFVHVTKDITERKRLEQTLVEKNDKLLEINAELHTLYQISQAISRTIDLDKLLIEVLAAITDIKIFRLERKGAIFIVDGNRMRLVASIGFSQTMDKLHQDMRVGDCLCGLAAAHGEIILSKRSDDDQRHTIIDVESHHHGHIIVPLKAANKVVGVLCLYLPADVDIEERAINLISSIAGQLGTAIENAVLYEKTKLLSLHDHLTGLANRRFMQIQVENNFSIAKRYSKNLSVIMLDIDHFKKFNDSKGHSEGDRLLVTIAKIMANNMREADQVFRYGGEEFLIILPETDLSMAAEVAERLRRSVADETEVSVSLGVSSYQDPMQTYEELIDKADNALYQAKHKGRNRVEVAPLLW